MVMEEQQHGQPEAGGYQDAEIVDYGSASEIVQTTGNAATDDGTGIPVYSS
jgi:hypothetical protein